LSSTPEAPAEAAAADERREQLLQGLQAELGDGVAGHRLDSGVDLWVRVATEAWAPAAVALRDRFEFEYFCFLSAIDWLPSPYGKGEDDPTQPPPERSSQVRQGYGGGETRFQVFARLTNIRTHLGITLKADVAEDTMAVESWARIYAGANWHERETWEMFGIEFVGHPNLTHLYLPSEFEGYPLRKDFPLLARMVKPWPGIVDVEPMPGDDAPAEGEAEA
jgi:NADH-quinone oxidoreductase subunit C